MPPPVDLVTIHHEGAGTPSNIPRGVHGGYTYWLGATNFTHLRTVWASYATLNYNHVSLDICLSGNRMETPVSDNDITLIRLICEDARARGYVINAPYVRSHHDSPGSRTVCPGANALSQPTWTKIVTACHKEAPPMPPTVSPEYFPALAIVSSEVFTHPQHGKCCAMIDAAGHVFTSPANAYMGSPYDDKTGQPKSYWGTRKAALVKAASPNGYIITAQTGETYGPKF